MEPCRLNNNYIDIWAYDTRDGVNKRFKVSRIDEVELLEEFPMDGVGSFVLGLPMFIEVLEGDELRSFLKENKTLHIKRKIISFSV